MKTKKKLFTKPIRNSIVIIISTLITISVIFLSKEVIPAQHKVEKPLDSKQFSKS